MEGVQSFFITRNEEISMEQLINLSEIRADGRRRMQFRTFDFEFSNNSAIIHFGKTLVSCSTTAEIVTPSEDRPSEGIHVVSMTSPNRMIKTFQTEALVQIRDCLHRTRALDLESLVIKIGEKVWCLKSDIVILNNDGGLFEACNLALIGSLLCTKLPGPRGPRPLVLHHIPIGVTFGYLNRSKIGSADTRAPYPQPLCIADPTYLESAVLHGILNIFVNAQGEICALHKNGGVPLSNFVFPTQSDTHINIAIEIALKIAKNWHARLMMQLGSSAPSSLANLVTIENLEENEDFFGHPQQVPVKETEEKDEDKTEEQIIQEVQDEFRKEADLEEIEEVNPLLLSLFS